jgi:cobalt/nickel transport system ATP-binding protein
MDDDYTSIALERIRFGYDSSRIVLRDVDFSLKQGDRVALHGPNGSGKTTLFHVIMGLVKPSAGTVRIFGEERTTDRDFQEVRRKIGLLFQDSDDQLFSPTVAEDIAFGPFNLGKERDEVRRIVAETLSLIGLEGFEERITYKLSGGEKRLVALGTVLSMDPVVLLLDEPVIGLDEEHRDRFMRVLNESRQSYIVISHDRSFLESVTSKAYRMQDGRIERI